MSHGEPAVEAAGGIATARSISWDDLVGAALLGTARRPVETSALTGAVGRAAATLPEPDPAARLLDAAAMITVFRRAGNRSPKITSSIRATDPETRRPTPAAAASRLDELLVRSGTTALLTEWLHTAGRAGIVAPPALLPALLDLAVRRVELVLSVVAILGERGRWLAAQRPDWDIAVRPAIAASVVLASAEAESQDDPVASPVWTHGTSAERRAWFQAMRTSDPAAATALLAGLDWRRERGDDRLAFVTTLRNGLSTADQPVLELAQRDRRQDVRSAAADLLVDLPDSTYAVTLAMIAGDCLRIERRLMRRTIIVTLPDPEVIDLEGAASGGRPVIGGTGAGVASGPAVRLLHWLLARVPLPIWEQSLAATPAELVEMPVADDLGAVVHAAWVSAAARQRNATWAEALAPGAELDRLAELLPALPSDRRAAVVAQVIDSDAVDQRHQREAVIMALLQTIEPPWPDDVTDAIVRWLGSRDPKTVPLQARGIVDLAGSSLAPDRPTAVRVAAAIGQYPEGSPWRRVIHALADVLLFRHKMLEELR